MYDEQLANDLFKSQYSLNASQSKDKQKKISIKDLEHLLAVAFDFIRVLLDHCKLSDVSQVYELGKEDSLQSAGQIDKIRNDVTEIALRLRNVLPNWHQKSKQYEINHKLVCFDN